MEEAFWRQRWDSKQIGFHEAQVHRFLVAHLDRLALQQGQRLFVPLCGKSVDLDWLLSRGHPVVAVEFHQEAVAEVFDRLGLVPDISQAGSLLRYEAQGLTIFCGDLFALRPSDMPPVAAVYDRAALVAIAPEQRVSYVRRVAELSQNAPQLLVTYDYDQSQMDGPPFSVPRRILHELFAETMTLEPLDRQTIDGPLARRCVGYEDVYLLR